MDRQIEFNSNLFNLIPIDPIITLLEIKLIIYIINVI